MSYFLKFPFAEKLQRDDSLRGREMSEDEYDALNDETFTHATADDWEGE